MSKIQKALGRLRGGGSGSRGEDDSMQAGPDSSDTDGSPAVRRTRPKPYRHRRYATSGGLDDEVGPATTIHIDTERLQEFGLISGDSSSEYVSQQFRRIKRPILNLGFGTMAEQVPNANVIMVASALPKSGKSFCSYNLSVSIARERDVGVVLVDADVLKPHISRAFDIADRVGLIDYLLDESIALDDIVIGTDHHGLIVIPAGQQHPEATELLASRRMEELVRSVATRFRSRAIIVDTPPLLLTNEAHVLADHMGQIVFIVEAGVTLQESVITALDSLNRDKPINAIINKARSKSPSGSWGQYYGYGYSYGYHGYGAESAD